MKHVILKLFWYVEILREDVVGLKKKNGEMVAVLETLASGSQEISEPMQFKDALEELAEKASDIDKWAISMGVKEKPHKGHKRKAAAAAEASPSAPKPSVPVPWSPTLPNGAVPFTPASFTPASFTPASSAAGGFMSPKGPASSAAGGFIPTAAAFNPMKAFPTPLSPTLPPADIE